MHIEKPRKATGCARTRRLVAPALAARNLLTTLAAGAALGGCSTLYEAHAATVRRNCNAIDDMQRRRDCLKAAADDHATYEKKR